MAAGKALREQTPRGAQAAWRAPAGRRDPVELLEEDAQTRVRELVPIRYGRMLASPMAFFRATAAIMVADVAPLPSSGLRAQCSGDAHLLNFGVFAAPDRRLVFDLNDFDQTLPAPVDWELKRLAASTVIATQSLGLGRGLARSVARAAIDSYAQAMRRCAAMPHLDLYYDRVGAAPALAALADRGAESDRRGVRADLARARAQTTLGSLTELAERQADGSYRLRSTPPLVERVTPIPSAQLRRLIADGFREYTRTLEPDKAAVLRHYRFRDSARKVSGVGSVGIQSYVCLLMGDRDDDPLFLQVKEARPSVLAPYAGASEYQHEGERVVRGQQLMHSTSDAFLGWLRHHVAEPSAPDFYVRQLRDHKGRVRIERLTIGGLRQYAAACGAVLAHAHARSGDAAAITGYLGTGSQFPDAMAAFAAAYAEQNLADYRALQAAERAGRIPVRRGI